MTTLKKPMADMAELLGFPKNFTDLESQEVKVRYTESTEVQSGNWFRITFPKRSMDASLDCRTVRMRFNLTINSTDPDCRLDSDDVRCIFNRVRILSGSTVLMDLSEASQYFVLDGLIHTSHMDAGYEKFLRGQEPSDKRATYTNGREYIIHATPHGCLLNNKALLPLERMSNLHLEYYLETPNKCLFSPAGDANATFTMSNIEFLCDYITSPSLSGYYNANGISFSCQDVSHRYNSILSQEYLLRMASAHTSLNSIITTIRPQSQIADTTIDNKLQVFEDGTARVKYNLLVNSKLWFEEDQNSVEQSWKDFSEAYPAVVHSLFFDEDYQTSRNVLCNDFSAAPPEFWDTIASGVRTARINSDIVYKIQRVAAPPTPLRADSYMRADVVVYKDPKYSDLKIKL